MTPASPTVSALAWRFQGLPLEFARRIACRNPARAKCSDDVTFRDRNWSFEVRHTHRIARAVVRHAELHALPDVSEVVTTNRRTAGC